MDPAPTLKFELHPVSITTVSRYLKISSRTLNVHDELLKAKRSASFMRAPSRNMAGGQGFGPSSMSNCCWHKACMIIKGDQIGEACLGVDLMSATIR